MEWAATLQQQAAAHPALAPQDAIKLCHQAAFGAAHLLAEEAQARAALHEEFSRVDAAGEAALEPVSPRYCRCSLGAWKRLGLPPDWLFGMFRHTAQQPPDADAAARLAGYLNTVDALARAGSLPFDATAWRASRRAYEAQGMGAVRHSDGYRLRERPAYRIVDARYAALLPLFSLLAALPNRPGARIVALDGRAASGKTTAAALLAAALGGGVIHMDDFFLPAALRTPGRFAQPGGNVHHERFAKEVLPRLSDPAAFSYRRFDCGTMDYGAPREVAPGGWRIVEGSYSCHPTLGPYMDVRVFCDVPPETQRQRLLARNGPAQAAVFTARWIPLEERYFAAYHIREAAQLVLETGLVAPDAAHLPPRSGAD